LDAKLRSNAIFGREIARRRDFFGEELPSNAIFVNRNFSIFCRVTQRRNFLPPIIASAQEPFTIESENKIVQMSRELYLIQILIIPQKVLPVSTIRQTRQGAYKTLNLGLLEVVKHKFLQFKIQPLFLLVINI